jgi:hypothetical protein
MIEIQRMFIAKHSTLMPHNNVLHVSVHKIHNQTQALHNFNNISRIIKKYKIFRHKFNLLNTNIKIFHTQNLTFHSL